MLIAVGVVLLVLAVLALLWGVLFLLEGLLLGSITSTVQSTGGAFSIDMGQAMDIMRPVLLVLAVVALIIGLGHGAAGIGVIGRRGWARITGLVLGGLGLLLNLLGVVVVLIAFTQARIVYANGFAYDQSAGLTIGLVVCAVFAAAYAFVVVVLARRGADFG